MINNLLTCDCRHQDAPDVSACESQILGTSSTEVLLQARRDGWSSTVDIVNDDAMWQTICPDCKDHQ